MPSVAILATSTVANLALSTLKDPLALRLALAGSVLKLAPEPFSSKRSLQSPCF